MSNTPHSLATVSRYTYGIMFKPRERLGTFSPSTAAFHLKSTPLAFTSYTTNKSIRSVSFLFPFLSFEIPILGKEDAIPDTCII
jgi:hypothetical protein